MSTENAHQSLIDFFDHYARALEQNDSKSLVQLHHIPCTMLSDDAHTLFGDASKLEGFFNQGLLFYRQFGIVHARPNIWSRASLTDTICRVKVNWQYFDKENKPIYNCDYHFVLKLDKHHHWKIILSVSVNEKERIEEWKAQQ
ncbi:MAG: hypothetical protein EBZ77_14280 [Chitinophagia bacterium]|nr:hypothetical protein [Chitinophagia bacterium]